MSEPSANDQPQAARKKPAYKRLNLYDPNLELLPGDEEGKGKTIIRTYATGGSGNDPVKKPSGTSGTGGTSANTSGTSGTSAGNSGTRKR
ncbi:hypothetical protein BT96DRAFT_979816 [Gymnopus androsaceus JB14]|uniref:Uncharacterized protein n=1 Tax=Gymnopus androsaceus JB14 TaxID=1447944 RepID=A0A6A4H2A9_9AGAR|nr:hypothetical protein BT96DRAFT_979816 [Gymnopus androsaceus JB14]